VTRFFDTNVLLYAFLDDPRRMRAQQALAEGGIISAQVLNEFTNVSRRKHQRDWPEIEAALGVIRGRLPVVTPLTEQTHAAALALARDHGFAFCDALIVAAAIEAGCDTLFTEDMQHGRTIDNLTICDPFRQGAS
jgi:predicted nucleic acid-binding protein